VAVGNVPCRSWRLCTVHVFMNALHQHIQASGTKGGWRSLYLPQKQLSNTQAWPTTAAKLTSKAFIAATFLL